MTYLLELLRSHKALTYLMENYLVSNWKCFMQLEVFLPVLSAQHRDSWMCFCLCCQLSTGTSGCVSARAVGSAQRLLDVQLIILEYLHNPRSAGEAASCGVIGTKSLCVCRGRCVQSRIHRQ